jgi:hypothetical protein
MENKEISLADGYQGNHKNTFDNYLPEVWFCEGRRNAGQCLPAFLRM